MQQQNNETAHFSGGLLDRLAELAGCRYLSDLCARCGHKTLLNALDQLVPQEYPLAEWEDAADYLLGLPHSFQTQQEAAQFLKDQLRGRENRHLSGLRSSEQ